MSRFKKIELVKLARFEADEECLAEEEQAKTLRGKMDRKNMVRKPLSQMQRVLAASNKQEKRRSRPTLASAASIAPDRQDVFYKRGFKRMQSTTFLGIIRRRFKRVIV